MFAVRFDPKQLAETEPREETTTVAAPIIPLKRTKHDEDEDNLEHDIDEVDNEETAIEQLESEGISSESDDDSSDEENMHDHKYMGLGDAFEANDDLDELEGDITPEEMGKSHSSVLSRFQKSMKLQNYVEAPLDSVEDGESTPDDGGEHALDNIPQPARVRNNAGQNLNEHKSIAWLHTAKIHYDNSMVKAFDSYSNELQPKLLTNIKKHFATDTFPIQTVLLDNVLPILNFSLRTTRKHLTRRVGDVLVNASTGSGKTLGYTIPIIQMLSKRTVNRLRVLIILPTKLLINQVYETINKLSQGTALIISMSKMEYSLKEEHKKFLQNEPDVLIITPGRLVDHLNMNSISLRNLTMLVLDEADHLLNQSFQNWCPELMNRIRSEKVDQMPGNVIKMVFSATLTTNTEKLHGLQLFDPKLFVMDSVKLYHLPPKLQEYNISIPTAKSVYKPLILLHLLDQLENAKILVFVKSNEASLRLASLLDIMIGQKIGQPHKIASINSNNSKGENKKLIHDFTVHASSSKIKILITTDLMSRGLDINDITDVINYDLPIGSQQYVHRCGRTARAQTCGNAYNLLVGKGERVFWSQSIDEDMSRDADGLSPKNWNEVTTNFSGDEEPSRSKTVITNITTEESASYKKCLDILKEKANAR